MTWCGRSDGDHRVRTCRPCMAEYARHRRKVGRMSPPSKKDKEGWQPTPLNLRTTRRYEKCQERGGCVPSRNIVERNEVFAPTCKSCGVPMMKLGVGTPWRKWTGDAA